MFIDGPFKKKKKSPQSNYKQAKFFIKGFNFEMQMDHCGNCVLKF